MSLSADVGQSFCNRDFQARGRKYGSPSEYRTHYFVAIVLTKQARYYIASRCPYGMVSDQIFLSRYQSLEQKTKKSGLVPGED